MTLQQANAIRAANRRAEFRLACAKVRANPQAMALLNSFVNPQPISVREVTVVVK